jgi:hypothetical protein
MKNLAYYTSIMLNRPVLFQAVNIVAYVVILIVNGLAGSTTVLAGVTSADISDRYTQLWLLLQGSPLLSGA